MSEANSKYSRRTRLELRVLGMLGVACVLVGAYFALSDDTSRRADDVERSEGVEELVARHARVRGATLGEESGTRVEVTPDVRDLTADAGTIVVNVLYSDFSVASDIGLGIAAQASGGRDPLDYKWIESDENGTAVLDGLEPGTFIIRLDRSVRWKSAEIKGGETTVVSFVIPVGLTLSGIVIREDGAPIKDASLVVGQIGSDCHVAGETDALGRFRIKGCHPATIIGARAEGYVGSEMHAVVAEDGDRRDITIKLRNGGGAVEGVVRDVAGMPIEGAVVKVGKGRMDRLIAKVDGMPAVPTVARTDSEGRFRAIGLAAGENPVCVVARRKQPWEGSCRVAAHDCTMVDIVMKDGCNLVGRVVGRKGTPISGAVVQYGDVDTWGRRLVRTGIEGEFLMDSLPEGHFVFAAGHKSEGKGSVEADLVVGRNTRCEIELTRGRVLRGHVVQESTGVGIGDAMVQVSASYGGRSVGSRTDADGVFKLLNVPDGAVLCAVTREGCEPKVVEVGAKVLDVAIALPALNEKEPSSRLGGTLVVDSGTQVEQCVVTVVNTHWDHLGLGKVEGDGRFETGLLRSGSYKVIVECRGLPDYASEWLQLGREERRDLGVIELQHTVRLGVRLEGVMSEGARVWLCDGRGYRLRLLRGVDGGAEGLVFPGRYVVMVDGPEVARRSTVCEIEEEDIGHGKTVSVTAERGSRVTIAIRGLSLTEKWRGLGNVRIVSDRGQSTTETVRWREQDRVEHVVCLAPGRYVATVSVGARGCQAEFVVAEGVEGRVDMEVR